MAPRPSPQTERVVNLFEHLAEDGSRGVTLAEVSRHLSVHKASCHSMLSELLRAGWLLRDPVRKTYHLGPAMVRLGREAAGRYPALVLARSAMAELSAATGAHCVAFSVDESVSTVVNALQLSGPEWPRGGYRIEFQFCLGEKSQTKSFYYMSSHHDKVRAAVAPL